MQNSTINFVGSGNYLFCEDGVKLINSTINFSGSDSVVYLSSSPKEAKLKCTIYNDCNLYVGKNAYYNGVLHVIISEQSTVFIGESALMSYGITMRTADPHLVFSNDTYERINPTKSIFIGDHVWLGQDLIILKGTQIGSGSIIGAGSVVAGKTIPHNTSWAGNPARQLAKNVFWDSSCVHLWTEVERNEAHSFINYCKKRKVEKDAYVFKSDREEYVSFDEIDKNLSYTKTKEERLKYMEKLSLNNSKNRFALPRI